ncbi:MAG: hypothetical protein KDJ65_23250 [Anaerolineae bacterium]|nr:hypothetical protein [Anaerolineae bacterium]
MAFEMPIYSLYHIHATKAEPAMLLVRIMRPAYRNAVQPEEDGAYQQEDTRRARLLEAYQSKHRATYGERCTLTLYGICEGEPPGDILYEDHGQVTLGLWVAATSDGQPWIWLGVAPTEEEFFREFETNSLYASTRPQRPAQQVTAYFITEADEAGLRGEDA